MILNWSVRSNSGDHNTFLATCVDMHKGFGKPDTVCVVALRHSQHFFIHMGVPGLNQHTAEYVFSVMLKDTVKLEPATP